MSGGTHKCYCQWIFPCATLHHYCCCIPFSPGHFHLLCAVLFSFCFAFSAFFSFSHHPSPKLIKVYRDKDDSYFSGHTKSRRRNNLSSVTSVDTSSTEPYRSSKPLREVTHRRAKIKPIGGHKWHAPTYALTTARTTDGLAVTRLK